MAASQKAHLDFLMISSLALSPWGWCIVPMRHIHLSSKLFNFSQRAHLQPGPFLWLVSFCCSSVTSMCSSSVIFMWDFFSPVSQGQPILKWLSSPVPLRLLTNRGPDQSGSCLILIRQPPDWSGCRLILIWQVPDRSGSRLISGSLISGSAWFWNLHCSCS